MVTQNSIILILLIVQITRLYGQVPVHEEPNHHTVFKNNELRILDVILPPGDSSAYHIHQTPSFFIFFTNSSTGSQVLGKSAVTGKNTAGRILFENLAPPNTRTHRVWNTDKDTFHVMDLELLYMNPHFKQAPLSMLNLSLEIDTTWIRAYRLTLTKGQEFELSSKSRYFILVSLNSAEIQVRKNDKTLQQTLQPGSFFEIGKRHRFSIENTADAMVKCILLEIPH